MEYRGHHDYLKNILRKDDNYKNVAHDDTQKWLSKGELVLAKQSINIDIANKIAFLISGESHLNPITKRLKPPCLINDKTVTLSCGSRIYVCNK